MRQVPISSATAASSSREIIALTGISNSRLIGDRRDHNVMLQVHPNCESRLVNGAWSRDAVHGLLERKALVQVSPINLHILVN